MSLVFMEGFDMYTLNSDVSTANQSPIWSAASFGNTGRITSGGRTGYYLKGSNHTLTKYLAAADQHATMIFGCAFMPSTQVTGTGDHYVYLMGDYGTIHITLLRTGTGFYVYRGNAATLLGSVSIPSLLPGTWTYIETKVLLSDTVGTVEVRINGNTTPAFSLTNQDTKNGGTAAVFDSIQIRNNYNGDQQVGWDDMYLCNGAGTVNNTFLGDGHVFQFAPTGAGTTTQLTPSTGSNYAAVDELPASSTDYVTGTAVGQKDTYAMADISNAPSGSPYVIKAVEVRHVSTKTDAGSLGAQNVVRSGGTDYDVGSSLGLSLGSYITSVTNLDTDPATSAAWTVANFNAMELGVSVKAS